MRPRKKGQQYEICYRCPGYTKPIYERFPTYEAANLRILRSNLRSPSVNFARQSKRPYKPNERRKSLSRSVSFWMNTCRSMG